MTVSCLFFFFFFGRSFDAVRRASLLKPAFLLSPSDCLTTVPAPLRILSFPLLDPMSRLKFSLSRVGRLDPAELRGLLFF